MNPVRTLAIPGLLAIALAGCMGTSRVMLAPPLPAVPVEQVRVYFAPPPHYREIARIETASGIGFGTEGQNNAAIGKLRAEAAKVGANGVLVMGLDTVRSPVDVGIGGGGFRGNVGLFGSVGIPTSRRRAAGIAILVEDAPAAPPAGG